MTAHLRTATIVPLIAGFMLAACAGGSEDSEETFRPSNYYSSAVAVCSLLRQPDLEAILGHQYSPGVSEFNPDFLAIPGINSCGYKRRDTKRRAPRVYSGVVYAYADQVFQEHLRLLRATDRAVSVKGVGERAVWDPASFQMFVLVDGKVLGLHSFPDLEPQRDTIIRVRRLALRAAERLR